VTLPFASTCLIGKLGELFKLAWSHYVPSLRPVVYFS